MNVLSRGFFGAKRTRVERYHRIKKKHRSKKKRKQLYRQMELEGHKITKGQLKNSVGVFAGVLLGMQVYESLVKPKLKENETVFKIESRKSIDSQS